MRHLQVALCAAEPHDIVQECLIALRKLDTHL